MTARAIAPAKPEKWPGRNDHQRVDEDPDHDRRQPGQDVDDEPCRPRRRLPPTSREKTARAIPIGTAISVASPVIISVPTGRCGSRRQLALRSPGGSLVKNSRLIDRMPWLTRKNRTAASGISASTRAR